MWTLCIVFAFMGGIAGVIYVIRQNIAAERSRRENVKIADIAHRRGISLAEARDIFSK